MVVKVFTVLCTVLEAEAEASMVEVVV